jgi:hypothetical protein
MAPSKRRRASSPSPGPEIVDEETVAHERDRRQDMADIARRRAAHFATWDAGGEDEGLHTGGSSARSLGPWSTAVELANAREQERAKREREMQNASSLGDIQAPSLPSSWNPSRNWALGPRPRCDVVRLKELSLRLVVDLLTDVVRLILLAYSCTALSKAPSFVG